MEGLGSAADGADRPQFVLKHLAVRLSEIGSEHIQDTKAEYAVDALWNLVPELADWDAYLTLLQVSVAILTLLFACHALRNAVARKISTLTCLTVVSCVSHAARKHGER